MELMGINGKCYIDQKKSGGKGKGWGKKGGVATFKLGPDGEELLKAAKPSLLISVSAEMLQEEIQDKQPSAKKKKKLNSSSPAKAACPVVTALKECRKQEADVAGVPPYQIFMDQQLDTIAQAQPTTIGQLCGLPGITELKARKYGEFGCLNAECGVFDDAWA